MIDRLQYRAPLLLLAIACAVRVLVALRTEIPSRDAAHYLWMAERVAGGDLAGAFQTVFHPLYALLVGGLLAVWPMDPVAAGQWIACSTAALAVVPLHTLTLRAFGARAALAAGLLYALGVWFARHPADCLSEGLFFLLVGCAVKRLVDERGSAVAAGILTGLAYGTRPEGAALLLAGAPWLCLRGEKGRAVRFVLAALPVLLLWPLGWEWLGDGFTLTPKAAFNWAVGAGDEEDGGAAHYLDHLLRVPLALWEAVGYVALPLAVLGVARLRPRLRDPTALLLALVLLQCAVVPLLRSNIRFLAGYGILVLPLAGVGFAFLSERLASAGWQRLARPHWLVVLLAFTPDLVRLPQRRGHERIVERELGRWLGARLEPGESIATDMPRLEYFAGLRPGPPRPVPAAEILEACKRAATRYAVVVQGRTPVTRHQLLGLGFSEVGLPPELATLAAERTLLVQERRYFR